MAQRQSILPTDANGYDAHHPPSGELIDKCVHCGFCLPVCPTYVLWDEEMDSPRGRIYLMKMVAEGAATMNETWVGHFDTCLGCMACMTACPSGVEYGKLIEATRAQIERRYARPAPEKRFRRFLFNVFTRPSGSERCYCRCVCIRRSGSKRWCASGIPQLLPARLRAMEALLPQLPAREKLPESDPGAGRKAEACGLIAGLRAAGSFPARQCGHGAGSRRGGMRSGRSRSQPCCGALIVHAGEEEQAVQLARQTIDVFEKARVDTMIINAAGCGSNVKEYGHLLRDDPQYAGRARPLRGNAAMFRNSWPSSNRGLIPRLAPARGLPRCLPPAARTGYPYAAAPLLAASRSSSCWRSPSCDLLRIRGNLQPGATGSRGGARRPESGHVAALGADMVVSGNPGCLLQLQSSLIRAGRKLPVHHSIELVDASIRGASL